MVDSVLINSGRSCISCSGIWVSRHGRAIAEALAERLGPVAPKPPDDADAALAAFTVPEMADGINATIDQGVNEAGVEEVTAQHRGGDRLIREERYAYLQPTVIYCESPDKALANTQRSQRTHIDWIEYLQTYPDFDTAAIGSQDFHQEFVQDYQVVIDTLTTHDEECRNLTGPSIALSALADSDKGLCSQGQLERANDAGRIARGAQRTHQAWVDYLLEAPDYDTTLVGSTEHHQRLVQDYQLLIDVSTMMIDGCSSLLEAGSQ